MRTYRANCDDGHDYFDFEYQSEHRAGSKANLEDAMNYYKHHYCKRNFRITGVELVKEY